MGNLLTNADFARVGRAVKAFESSARSGDASGPSDILTRSRPLLCHLTGRPAGNADDRVFLCRVTNPAITGTVMKASITFTDVVGLDVFTEAIFIDFAQAVDPNVTTTDNVYADGWLRGYTSDDPPLAIFSGLAVQAENCGTVLGGDDTGDGY